MIRSIIRNHPSLTIVQGPAQPEKDLDIVWLEINAPTEEERVWLHERFNINMDIQNSSVVDDGNFLYMRCELLSLTENGTPHFDQITFILGDQLLATLCSNKHFHPFGDTLLRLNRKRINAQSPKAVLRVLLRLANDSADRVIDRIADELSHTTEEISEISEGYNAQGKELGVPDLIGTIRSLNAKEQLISQCLEAQLSLARTVRYLSGEIDDVAEAELQTLVSDLTGDVNGVKEHAHFEHEKVRYLQNAVTNILNIKQNQIVKVFTIITAVFLPPTLVATFYGMNFAVMPELSWQHGFIYSMILTLAAALVPLAYIKCKGWLR